MIISPPFLPTRTANQTDADYVVAGMPSSPVNCPQTSVPEGSYPISLNMGWHGGTHYQAPSQNSSAITVRAIADGEIVFARKPTTANTTPEDPLNYNPYGTQPTWTDDGLVIIKHTTDIGTAETATGIVYYSLISHLAQLKGNAAKVAAGTATAADKKIYRKDEIGNAGQIYGGNASNHIHMEIVCDDDNLQKILGRQNLYDDLDTSTHGRADAIYGEIYFRLPIGTKLYQTQPADNIITPPATNPVATTLDKVNIIGLRYETVNKSTPSQQENAYLTTYKEDGSIIGNNALLEAGAGSQLYETARRIRGVYRAALINKAKAPALSAIYMRLRFGRDINTQLNPANLPHWRQVKYDGGEGWVNLNQDNITIYSDADFPPWKGWRLIHDDLDGDSRCTSANIIKMIEDASNADGKLSKAELIQRMGLPAVRTALKKTICAFPSEWVQDTLDARWGWLKTDPDYKLEGKDWDNYRQHVEALTVPASKLPEVFSDLLWHFEPSEFIKQFQPCYKYQAIIDTALNTRQLPIVTNLTDVEQAELYERMWRIYSAPSASALYEYNNGKKIAFALRIETSAKTPKGQFDDGIVMLQKQQGVPVMLFDGMRAFNTEPAGKYEALNTKNSQGHYLNKRADGNNADGEDADGDGRKDLGRLPEGSYQYSGHHSNNSALGPNLFETNFNVLRGTVAVELERDSNHDGFFNQNDDNHQHLSDSRTVYLHRGYNGFTGSAGCQTFKPSNDPSKQTNFKDFFKAIDITHQHSIYYTLRNL